MTDFVAWADGSGLILASTAFGAAIAVVLWPGLTPPERNALHWLAIPMALTSELLACWVVHRFLITREGRT